MIDFGFDKIALIGAVALIVIGPEKLPRVARTVGHLIGKAQRYVADVKAEVNRSIELDELKKMKGEFEDAARGVEQSVNEQIHQTTSDLNNAWNDAEPAPDSALLRTPCRCLYHCGMAVRRRRQCFLGCLDSGSGGRPACKPPLNGAGSASFQALLRSLVVWWICSLTDCSTPRAASSNSPFIFLSSSSSMERFTSAFTSAT